MALLQNAVKDIPQLCIVETLDEYTSTTCGDGSFTHLNYSTYYNLLINACVRYDATITSTPSKRRNVYAAAGTQDFSITKNPTKHSSLKTLTHHQMIFIRYIRPNIGESPTHHYLASRGIIPKSQPPLHPRSLLRNMMDLYMSLLRFKSSSVLRQLLPLRNTILKPSMKLLRKVVFMSLIFLIMTYPQLRIPFLRNNVTFIKMRIHLKVRLIQSLITYENMNQALQAYNVMTSPFPDDTPHWSINLVHTHLFYHMTLAKQAQHGSLVDRGANGGLAGSDVRILSKSSRKCTVTGIDQHQINGLDIVQCAALVKTNRGYVNLIMNEYAYYGKGYTIHSSGQIEWN